MFCDESSGFLSASKASILEREMATSIKTWKRESTRNNRPANAAAIA